MEAAAGRRVRSGREFEHLFPPPTGKDRTIKKSADVADTVRFIQDAVPEISWQTDKIAQVLKGRTLEETCSNIWHFVYDHIPYKRDEEGIEQVRSPRRSWYDRNKPGIDKDGNPTPPGVDCDCYTVLISSMLLSVGNIPHYYRITKYIKKWPEVPRWQHIYIVVPKSGKQNADIHNREDYIVLDCVKNGYDKEEPFLESKDYKAKMKLDYLDGLDDVQEYEVPGGVDVQDIASVYDEEELGKLGQWIKKAVSNVGTAVKTVANKVADAAGDVMHAVNKVVNPATILLRNGFLLAMKTNMLNVARRMRYAYLTDDQATKMGINLSELNKLRTIKNKAEDVYWAAGGEKSNLRKAILEGKGNGDNKVPLAGLGSLGSGWAMERDGYIPNLNGLGEPVTATALASAAAAVGALAASLKQIKALFQPNAPSQENFESESEDAPPSDQTMPAFDMSVLMSDQTPMTTTWPAAVSVSPQQAVQAVVPGQTVLSKAAPITADISVTTEQAAEEKPGFFKRTTTWIKENPGKTALITGGAVLTTAAIVWAVKRSKKKKSPSRSQGLSGLPGKRKATRKPKRKPAGKKKKAKVKTVTIK